MAKKKQTAKTVEESLPEIQEAVIAIYDVFAQRRTPSAIAVAAMAYVNGYTLASMSDELAEKNSKVLTTLVVQMSVLGAEAGAMVKAKHDKRNRPTKAAALKAVEDLLKGKPDA